MLFILHKTLGKWNNIAERNAKNHSAILIQKTFRGYLIKYKIKDMKILREYNITRKKPLIMQVYSSIKPSFYIMNL